MNLVSHAKRWKNIAPLLLLFGLAKSTNLLADRYVTPILEANLLLIGIWCMVVIVTELVKAFRILNQVLERSKRRR